jgi:hypothetical protein
MIEDIIKKYQNKSYFTYDELKCPCCGECHIDKRAFIMLYQARVLSGIPFIINSAYRCPAHNIEIGSTSQNHTEGKAFDISCLTSGDRILIVSKLLLVGFKRIGLHKTFIHADCMPKRDAFWIGKNIGQ